MVMYAIALLAGCGSGRVQQLENENRALRQRINSCEERSAKIKKQRDELEKEIYAMKRGADYHYSIGCDAMNDDSGGRGYELAEKEFRLILQKWPASPVVKHARERLAEIGRQKEKEIRHIQEEDRRAE